MPLFTSLYSKLAAVLAGLFGLVGLTILWVTLFSTGIYQNEVTQIAKNRHKVWDQINRAEGLGGDANNEKLCIPRCSGVACSQVKSKGLRLEMSRTLFQFCEQCHIVLNGRPTACLSCGPDIERATTTFYERPRFFCLLLQADVRGLLR